MLGKVNQVILVYDATNVDSFHLLRQWYEGICNQNPGRKLSGVVIGNKIDLENRIAVAGQEGQAFAQSIGFDFFETSALQSRNIEEPFQALASMFRAHYEEKVSKFA